MLTKPMKFVIKTQSNENFEVSIPFPWVASQWPLPEGSYFVADIRPDRASSDKIVSFATPGSPRVEAELIIPIFDAETNILHLGLFAPHELLTTRARQEPYVMDILLVRPRGAADARIDVIGDGTVKIVQGVTRD